MPELPEVQTTVNGLNKYATGLTITDIWSDYSNASGFHTGKDNIKDQKFLTYFKKNVIGRKITRAERRAKNIIINLNDNGAILIHMKMTGHLLFGEYTRQEIPKLQSPISKQSKKNKGSKETWESKDKSGALGDPFNRHIRFVFSFSNGKHLALSDMRRFAKITYIPNEKRKETLHLKDIGPEPLEKDFTVSEFKKRLLLRPNGKIKQILLEPKIIAGIGNIYSDEILWRANIHPERKIKDINEKEFILMFKAMQDTLKKGIDFGGDSMSDYRNILGERGKFQEKHEAYRRTGLHCKKKGCKGIIIRKVVGARSAHFCNTHQK